MNAANDAINPTFSDSNDDSLEIVEERLERSLAAGKLAWWELEYPSGRVRFNEQKVRMLGYTMEEFGECGYSAFTDLVHPDDYEPMMRAMRRVLNGSTEIYETEYRIQRKDGSYAWFYDRGGVTHRSSDGTPSIIKGVVIDISDRKRAETALQEAHEQQRLLLREIQHRTKNNLNLVGALIVANASRMNDSRDEEILTELSDQISALARAYEYLTPGPNPDEVELRGYLTAVAEGIAATAPPRITVRVECEQVAVSGRAAVPIGLIVNELITNAVQHAFPTGRSGSIVVTLEKNDGATRLTVADDGIGIPLEAYNATNTFGRSIINALVTQLGAELSISVDNGSRVTIDLPET